MNAHKTYEDVLSSLPRITLKGVGVGARSVDPEASVLPVAGLVEEFCGRLSRITTKDLPGVGVVGAGSSRSGSPSASSRARASAPSLCRRFLRI